MEKDKIGKPKQFTDAEAEAFTRYLTRTRKGRVNRLIDDVFHPFYDKSKWYVIADAIAHSFVEKDPLLSLAKFCKYSLRELLRKK